VCTLKAPFEVREAVDFVVDPTILHGQHRWLSDVENNVKVLLLR
jgi:hypothetical protein